MNEELYIKELKNIQTLIHSIYILKEHKIYDSLNTMIKISELYTNYLITGEDNLGEINELLLKIKSPSIINEVNKILYNK